MMTTAQESFMKRLPKMYRERVFDFYQEDGLIDGCKYMLEFATGWYLVSSENISVACKSIAEAIKFVKEATH